MSWMESRGQLYLALSVVDQTLQGLLPAIPGKLAQWIYLVLYNTKWTFGLSFCP